MGPTDCETKCLVQSITIFEGFGSVVVVVDSLFIDAPIVCVFFLLDPCFVKQFLVPFLSSHPSH